MPTQQTAEKCKAINVIISDESKTLHFVGQLYKRDFFTKEQMAKYEILADLDKVWEKALTHFTDLYALHKAYGHDRAANSGFESAAHVRENSSGHSVITTESNITRDLYVESLEESLVAACEYVAKNMAARAAPPPANEQLTLLCNDLDAQCKQFKLVMEQNSKLLAAHSPRVAEAAEVAAAVAVVAVKIMAVLQTTAGKGGGGGGHGGGRGGGGGSGNSTFREKKLCPNRNKWVVHFPAECFSLEANKNKCPTGWKAKPAA
jgi:hypothetical protein